MPSDDDAAERPDEGTTDASDASSRGGHGTRRRRRIRPTTIIGLLAIPVVIAGLYYLMVQGEFVLAAGLLAFSVLAMFCFAIWEFLRGHPAWAALLLVGALGTVAVVGWYGWQLNGKLENIARVDDRQLDKGKRPEATGPSGALNILLMGTDNPKPEEDKPTVAELLEDGTWDPGAYRSDTLMVLHIPADRKSAYIVSVPRDSYVQLYDAEGKQTESNKINAAFSFYGPFGTWRTVENLSGLRLDHMAMIDFEGFRDLTEAIGGVDVYLPEEVEDPAQKITWPQGWNHIEGDRALKYVRQRYNLDEGDFDRVNRQQNFLRAVLTKVVDSRTIGDPTRFPKTLDAITSHLTVDQGFSNDDIRGLALSMRNLSPSKVRFVTLPLGSYDTVNGASVVRIDEQRAAELWKSIGNDTLDDYLKNNPDDELPDPKEVD